MVLRLWYQRTCRNCKSRAGCRERSLGLEVEGRPIPIVALAISDFAPTEKGTYSSSYISAGFSGGAIVSPLGTDEWTIAGIITHFPTVRRPVYRADKKTEDYVPQHTGLVGFTPMEGVDELINESRAKLDSRLTRFFRLPVSRGARP